MDGLVLTLVSVGTFIVGFLIASLLFHFFMKSFFEIQLELIKTLEVANRDNERLLAQNKQPVVKKYVITDKDLKKALGVNDEVKEKPFNQRQFFIDELIRLEAKGWTEEDTTADLERLYVLLSGRIRE